MTCFGLKISSSDKNSDETRDGVLTPCSHCSILLPPTLIHFMYCLIISCRTLGKMTAAVTCIRVKDLVVSPRESRTPGFSCTPVNGNPIVTGQVSEGALLLSLHFQFFCYQRCHSSGHVLRGQSGLERHHADGCPKASLPATRV